MKRKERSETLNEHFLELLLIAQKYCMNRVVWKGLVGNAECSSVQSSIDRILREIQLHPIEIDQLHIE